MLFDRRRAPLSGPVMGLCVVASALVIAACVTPAHAAVTVFSASDHLDTSTGGHVNTLAERDAYVAAASALGTDHVQTFEASPFGAFSSLNLGFGAVMTGVDALGGNQKVAVVPLCADIICGYNTTPNGAVFVQLYGGTATIDFANPISALAAFIGGAQTDGMTLTFTDGSTHSIAIPNVPGLDFVGFVDPGASISKVTFDVTGDIVSLDDLHFTLAGDTAPTPSGAPEPATWAMMLLGFAGTGVLIRRRRRTRPLAWLAYQPRY